MLDKIILLKSKRKEQFTDMLQIPKAGIQNHGQEPEEMRSIYFSLESQTNLAQASRTPGNTITVHSKEGFSSKLHQQKLHALYIHGTGFI